MRRIVKDLLEIMGWISLKCFKFIVILGLFSFIWSWVRSVTHSFDGIYPLPSHLLRW